MGFYKIRIYTGKNRKSINFVCDHNSIDKSPYNLAPSAKNIEIK